MNIKLPLECLPDKKWHQGSCSTNYGKRECDCTFINDIRYNKAIDTLHTNGVEIDELDFAKFLANKYDPHCQWGKWSKSAQETYLKEVKVILNYLPSLMRRGGE